ncbi:MAG: GGDEF domain-containing protein [Clostridiales bacterium]|nr:GGDEF domain-containing protein [Clostridiales bacterium]
MDYKEFVDMFEPMTCIISVESKGDGSYGEIRIVTGNAPYIASIEQPNEDVPSMLTDKFVPNRLYQKYFPKDLNFEEFCYRCAVKKEPMHTYVHPERYDFWFNLYMLPLGSEGDLHYCTYTQILSQSADAEQMSNISNATATEVLNTCIKLRGTKDFRNTMEEVISDIRKMCDAELCVILLTDSVERTCEVLCESMSEDTHLMSMRNIIDDSFIDLTDTWMDTIGGSNCLIVKNRSDMEFVREKNPLWYQSLTEKKVERIVLFPLKSGDEILGYIWATNFKNENTVKIKETLELTTFFLASEIGNHLLLERLKILSTIDMLTGVYNRNEMNNRIDALREPDTHVIYNFGIVFADLNGLKRVNDTEGHNAGDLLLKNGALVLENAFIGHDVYRAGGDEFMVFVTDTTEEELAGMCDRAKENAGKFSNVSFALGYCFAGDSGNIVDVLKTADERMYKDKEEYYKQHPELKR